MQNISAELADHDKCINSLYALVEAQADVIARLTLVANQTAEQLDDLEYGMNIIFDVANTGEPTPVKEKRKSPKKK